MFEMKYTSDYGNPVNINYIIKHTDDMTLTQFFLHFIEMTRMIGYTSSQWDNVIKDCFKYCIVHDDAPADYNVFDWAANCISD